MTDQPNEDHTPGTGTGTGNEQPTELRDSSPNAGGPDRAAGDMGISSEREDSHGTDGERDTTAPAHRDAAGDVIGSDADFEQGEEDNPEGIEPKAGYPSRDPRSSGDGSSPDA